MGTRSVIARPSDEHLFEGVYVHWDGYPSGVGAAVHAAARFFGSPELAAQWLIDDHPAGWSSLASCDLSLPLRQGGSMHRHDALCRECKRSYWRHYAQYYADHGLERPEGRGDGTSQVFDHGFEAFPDPLARGACPFPENEKPDTPLRGDGDDWGTEYAYVIAGQLHIYDRVWSDDGNKMVGMFGAGAAADQGIWRHVTAVAWDAEFDGDAIETEIRLHHDLRRVAIDAGLPDKTTKDA
jgi:hypothetical protein